MSLPDHTVPLFFLLFCLVFIGSLLQSEIAEELVQVSIFHVLGDHAQRVCVHTHRQQANDVGVPQTRHDPDLLQEVVPAAQRGGKRFAIHRLTEDWVSNNRQQEEDVPTAFTLHSCWHLPAVFSQPRAEATRCFPLWTHPKSPACPRPHTSAPGCNGKSNFFSPLGDIYRTIFKMGAIKMHRHRSARKGAAQSV